MKPLPVIPQSVLNRGYRQQVHVQGWSPGCTFLYVRTDADGIHHLITPRTRRAYTTRNDLCYTKRNQPSA